MMRRTCMWASFVVAAALCGTPGFAQPAPAWSRGLQLLSTPVSEASRRAEAAMQAEGYSVTNRSNPSEDAFFLGGQKGPHSAVIMCDRNADGKTWVNIVVASTSGDGGVPGLERQRLQARMDNLPLPPPTAPGAPPPTPANPGRPADWLTDTRDLRSHIGERFTFTIPPNGTGKGCWGTDIYTDDSSIGTAAVHAGLITFERGGTVTVEIRPGLRLPGYVGSTRNGVECRRWDGAPTSFVFVSGGASDVTGAASAASGRIPSAPPEGVPFPGYLPYASRNQVGKRFTYQCRPHEGYIQGANLYGTDVYTDDTGVCAAAAHSGLITFDSGGTVTIEIRPGQASYRGSTRYGVTSASSNFASNYSFVFVR